MQYVEQTYFTSPAYMTMQGRPMVTDFAIDNSYSIDWIALNASMSTHPLFIFQNNSGFSHVLSGGGYSWVIPTSTDYGVSYLTSFYDTGKTFPNGETIGATYKGFNDTLASWGLNRVMGQQCGQTWLKTFSLLNSLYNSSNQLPYLQLVTWNDYEEATEIESGIDNCMTVSASISKGALQWSVSGNENTLDHYQVYISSDGQNLMPLTENAPGNRSVNLCSFAVPNGSYKLFVQAVGKPIIANQITSAVAYSPACGSSNTASSGFSLNASPTSVVIPAGNSGSVSIAASSTSGSLSSPIALSCSGLPSTLSCSFSPATIAPGSGTAKSTLTIASLSASATNQLPAAWKILYATGVLPLGIAGLAFIGTGRRRRTLSKTATLVVLCAGISLATVSCGGGSATQRAVSVANTYSIQVNAISNGLQQSTTVTVNVP
jgi:hypothetical protein